MPSIDAATWRHHRMYRGQAWRLTHCNWPKHRQLNRPRTCQTMRMMWRQKKTNNVVSGLVPFDSGGNVAAVLRTMVTVMAWR